MSNPRRTPGDFAGLLLVIVVALAFAAGSIVLNTPTTATARPFTPLALRSDVALRSMMWHDAGDLGGKGLGRPTYTFRGSDVLITFADYDRPAPSGTLTVAGVAARAAAIADIDVDDLGGRGCIPQRVLRRNEVDVGGRTILSPTCLRVDLTIDGLPASFEYRVPVEDGRFARLTPFLDGVRNAIASCASNELITVAPTCHV